MKTFAISRRAVRMEPAGRHLQRSVAWWLWPASQPHAAGELTDSLGMKLLLIPGGEFEMGQLQRGALAGFGKNSATGAGMGPRTFPDPAMLPQGAGIPTAPRPDQAVILSGGSRSHASRVLAVREGGPATARRQKLRGTWPGQRTSFPVSDDHPVTWVDWNDAVAFWKCFLKRRGQRIGCHGSRMGYACRAGTTTRFTAELKGK